MNIAPDTVTGESVSEAWLNAVLTLRDLPDRTACHLVTRITNPTIEVPFIRAAADGLSETLEFRTVRTVANTIFPAQLARAAQDEKELGRRYRRMYPTIKKLDTDNDQGTYFGRLVSYPNGSVDGFDQLADLIRKLRVEHATRGPKSARYEISAEAPGDETGSDVLAAPVYTPGKDRSPMGFPCLSFCSFQLDHGRLHLIAHYRRQHLIARGYGNYLGLSQLLTYVSNSCDLEPGQLMIVAGVAMADAAKYRLAWLEQQCSDAFAATT